MAVINMVAAYASDHDKTHTNNVNLRKNTK